MNFIYESDVVSKLHETACVALFHQNKILLLRRGSTAPWKPLHWALCGGGIEEGETSAEAVAREMKEEIGVSVSASNLQFLFKKPHPEDGYVLDVYYYNTKNPQINLNFEHDQYKWCEYEETKSLNLVPNLDQIIDALKSRGFFSITENKNMNFKEWLLSEKQR